MAACPSPQLALKAICMAAKAVVKFFMAMLRRPIAHEDPALYAAHVLLYHRAPLHVDEKQTTVVLRDMMDNGTYQWLDLDVDVVADDVWRQTAVNKLNVLKSNDEIGYKILVSAAAAAAAEPLQVVTQGAFQQQQEGPSQGPMQDQPRSTSSAPWAPGPKAVSPVALTCLLAWYAMLPLHRT